MLGEMLKREGVTVEGQRPVEQRGIADMGQNYVVAMMVVGTTQAIKVAIDKFHKHTHDQAEVTIEDDEQGNDSGN
jgi:hypothetical protein